MDSDMRRLLIAFMCIALPLAAAFTRAQGPSVGSPTPRTSTSSSVLVIWSSRQ
jgi:hypothetical protein